MAELNYLQILLFVITIFVSTTTIGLTSHISAVLGRECLQSAGFILPVLSYGLGAIWNFARHCDLQPTVDEENPTNSRRISENEPPQKRRVSVDAILLGLDIVAFGVGGAFSLMQIWGMAENARPSKYAQLCDEQFAATFLDFVLILLAAFLLALDAEEIVEASGRRDEGDEAPAAPAAPNSVPLLELDGQGRRLRDDCGELVVQSEHM